MDQSWCERSTAGCLVSDPGSPPEHVIEQLLWLLEDLQLTYAVGGSMAGTFHGEPRTTHDIDVLVALDEQSATRLTQALDDDYYIPERALRDAIRTHSCFNLVHIPTSFKIDLFVAGHSRLDREQLARRIKVRLRQDAERSIWLTSPEVLVVRKLLWRRSAQDASPPTCPSPLDEEHLNRGSWVQIPPSVPGFLAHLTGVCFPTGPGGDTV